MSRSNFYEKTNTNLTSLAASESLGKDRNVQGLFQDSEDRKPTDEYLQSMPDPDQFIDGLDGFDPVGEEKDQIDFDVVDQWIGDLDAEEFQVDTSDLRDKRNSFGDQDEDDEGGGKRRKSQAGSAKKPGRKPVAAEPTTKRKAQNRAAQRAFRDRKEKHLKDLETKVEDLEKASESATNENSLLRRHVEKLQDEVKQYRKRMSMISSSGGGGSPTFGSTVSATTPTARNPSNSASSDFRFEFPLFGQPSPNSGTNLSNPASTSTTQSGHSATLPPSASNFAIPGVINRNPVLNLSPTTIDTSHSFASKRPPNSSDLSLAARPTHAAIKYNSDDQFASFGGIIDQPNIQPCDDAPSYFADPLATPTTSQQPMLDQLPQKQSVQTMQGQVSRQYSNPSSINTDSPDSQQNNSSVCTSPGELSSPPRHKLTDQGLNAVREECQTRSNTGAEGRTMQFRPNQLPNEVAGDPGSMGASALDPISLNWLVQQNGGAFDPVLFGDYREPEAMFALQDFGTYFNEAYPPPELGSPEQTFPGFAPSNPRLDLVAEVEAAQDGSREVESGQRIPESMICPKLREELKLMRRGHEGETDIDGLCKAMRLKARCSERGSASAGQGLDKLLGSTG